MCPVFLEEHPYETVCEYYPDVQTVGVFLATPDPGPKFGVIAGGIIYALRSVLDQLVWQLAKANGGNPPIIGGPNQFPIYTPAGSRNPVQNAADFQNRAARSLANVAAPHRAFIETLQPYNCPDPAKHPLAFLADLSNMDKHNVIPVAVALRDEDFGRWRHVGAVADVERISAVDYIDELRLKNGAAVAVVEVVPNGPDPQVQVQSESSRYIAFAHGRLPLTTGLYWIGVCVGQIVEALLPAIDDPSYNPPLIQLSWRPPKPVYRDGTPLPASADTIGP
ncbi:MAG: hypothetical protein QOJ35_2776 [Solirubrobacteraceae bacterium]|nr:hypothetical protein [Solirubrobacteraceae bacterium]